MRIVHCYQMTRCKIFPRLICERQENNVEQGLVESKCNRIDILHLFICVIISSMYHDDERILSLSKINLTNFASSEKK